MRQVQYKILIIFIILSFFLGFAVTSLNNSHVIEYTQRDEHRTPEIAQDPISHWAISQNATTIYRLFETINFTINTFDFSGANYTKMQISFTNGSIREYDMQYIGDNRFTHDYRPEYDAPLGMQNVSFLIYNETHQLLNTHTTYKNFTIASNYLVSFFNSENQLSQDFFINETLTGQLLVSNFKTFDFRWNTTIINSVDELIQEKVMKFERNIVQFRILLKNETFDKNKFYYLQLNMTDKNSGRTETAYFPFYLKNNKPIITSSIKLSPEEIFRSEEVTISFNVTDIESKSEDLIPVLRVYDAEGEKIIQKSIDYVSNDLFSGSFTINANRPTGNYRVNVTLFDEYSATSSKVTYLTVKNNPPEIHSYRINGLSMDQPISIFYGRDLVFTFNVSDIEGIAYVKVALLSENNEWFNITRAYIGENTEISIRTIDLIDGLWFVYIYVIDTDGTVVSLIDDYDKAPQGIRIVPDIIGYYLPWILIFGGLIFGLLLGVITAYSYFKSKRESLSITPKKSPKKPITKKKTTKKVTTEELEKEKIEEPESEKETEEIPQRKIKRKL